jgi:dTDP-glucose pyrophosphorylase
VYKLKNQSEYWEESIVSIDTPIKVALQQLDKLGMKIALVLDKDRQLLGTISDGDFRRGMLRGLTLEDVVGKIMNKDPRSITEGASTVEILELMNNFKISQIPIVNRDKQVIGLHLWHEVTAQSKYSNVMIIMAGGRGSRLHPQTENIPKPMLLVAGTPILEHIIKRAKNQGFQNFIVSLCYLGEIIEKYFGDGQKFGVNIEYIREESPLGTAGALSLLQNKPKSAFIVTNGDVITDINYFDFLEFHRVQSAVMTVAVHTYDFQIPYGVVKIKDLDVTSYEEKPVISNLINSGVYALNPEILNLVKEQIFVDMPEILEMAKDLNKKVIVYPMHESWIDIGRPIDLDNANKSIN